MEQSVSTQKYQIGAEFGFVLASASPRRIELLRNLGIKFEVIPSGIAEDMGKDLPPEQLVVGLARAKAEHVANRLPTPVGKGLFVLGGDTVVYIDGKVLGQPATAADAERMLNMLSGACHQVYTGIAIIRLPEGKLVTGYEVSKVYIRSLQASEIKAYVETGESMDKAGAYALQGIGAALVERVEGCVTNIIGLPVPLVVAMLRQSGVPILDTI